MATGRPSHSNSNVSFYMDSRTQNGGTLLAAE
ncbi:hypothetical protein COLO4_11416 [Corchorus olitorius]|uniref:Uncharacterized protein n=1 Tax=Corchorus olitorius TaxID=93759 RepID=A0A1R3K4L0_9ROSI|nr:hypothetical protein COLO4_11416 [Corchorus olitorius]